MRRTSTYDHNKTIMAYELKEVDICPNCHKGIRAEYLSHSGFNYNLVVTYICPVCEELIISKYRFKKPYEYSSKFTWNLESVYPYSFKEKEFEDTIKAISKNFCNVYNQAKAAEDLGLDEICGIGYRKALEFLIKDYAKSENCEEEHEKIEKKPLKQCIDTYVTHPELKACSTGAVYLGNDETHYIRKWFDKDIQDLKKLIELTITWIHMNELTKKYRQEMGL